MKNYAIVKDGVVIRNKLTDSPGAFFGREVLARLVPCPLNVRPGWVRDNGTFSPPALDTVKASKRGAIKAEGRALMAAALPYDDFISAVFNALPQDVQDTLQPIVDAGRSAVQAVNAAATSAEVDAVTPTWPS